MHNSQISRDPKNRRPRGAVLEQLGADLLRYLQHFVKRYQFRSARIAVHLHQGQVVKVTHTNATPFPVADASGAGRAAHVGKHRKSDLQRLPPDEINARIGLRLNRLLRHFGVRYGALQIRVNAEGAIKTIRLSLPLRPAELTDFVRLLSELSQQRSRHRLGATGSGSLTTHHGRRNLHLLSGGRRNSGARA